MAAASSPALARQALELRGIELVAFHYEPIAGSISQEPVPARPQCLPQARHIHVERVPCRIGWLASPQVFDESVGRYGFRCVDQEAGDESPLTGGTEFDSIAVEEDFELAQDPALHTRVIVSSPLWVG
jgi:hypothetical protein